MALGELQCNSVMHHHHKKSTHACPGDIIPHVGPSIHYLLPSKTHDLESMVSSNVLAI